MNLPAMMPSMVLYACESREDRMRGRAYRSRFFVILPSVRFFVIFMELRFFLLVRREGAGAQDGIRNASESGGFSEKRH